MAAAAVIGPAQARVVAVAPETPSVRRVELATVDGSPIVGAAPGAHVDLHLPGGVVRSYSLVDSQAREGRFTIAVKRLERGRGGSRLAHKTLRPGATLPVSPPRNTFAFEDGAPAAVFIAGGIGITPFPSMIRRAQQLSMPWELHYAAASPQEAPLLAEIGALADAGGGRVLTYFTRQGAGLRPDVRRIAGGAADGAHLYCCGPQTMLDSFHALRTSMPPSRLHSERFGGEATRAAGGGYVVTLARTGIDITVREGMTILDTLLDAGIDVPHSCCEGFCGTCRTGVIAGTPDHRDVLLSDAEKAANDQMMICCSGSLDGRLVLDL